MRHLLALVLVTGGTDGIDRRISERWDAEGVRPAALADDYEFLRRLSLDLRGVIPTPEEVRAFVADRETAKRERVIDAWLRSESFAAYWSKRWSDELTIQVAKNPELNDGFRDWVRDSVRSNMPFDRFAKRILTAKGPTDLDPAAGFLVTALFFNNDGIKDVAERVGRVFLGTQIRCAECHDHPFDDWTQQDFYGVAAFFWQAKSEVRNGVMAGPNMAGTAVGLVVDDPARGEAHLPIPVAPNKTGDKKAPAVKVPTIGPRYKSGGAEPAEGEARRAAFARLLTSDRQFARAAVNRHWGMLLGRGFVHPLDGFGAARKPSHPELLEEMADDFVKSGYDPRRLLKSILMSRPYQLTSRGTSAARLFAQAAVTPLRPDQLFESIVRATGRDTVPENPKGKGGGGKGDGFRETFFREFRPDTESADPTISQALFFLNGEIISGGTSAARGRRLARILEQEPDPARRLEELFLCTVSRPPSDREAKALLERIRKAGEQPSAYEDVYWALINSTEFVTRH